MGSAPIKVLVVDDSPIARTVMARIFGDSDDVVVAGIAANGQEAMQLIAETNPDVVCTDLHMPVMDGMELTRQIMANCPRPILVISNAVDDDNQDNAFALLNAGAVDVFPKPKSGAQSDYDQIVKDLIRRVRVLAGVRVFRKGPRRRNATAINKLVPLPMLKSALPEIVVLGASTGGPQAFQSILSKLPPDFPVPLVCIQHIGEGFLRSLVAWLNTVSRIHVTVAQPGETIKPGTVYFAPDGVHVGIDSNRKLITTDAEPLGGHRPSITHTFRSAANAFGKKAVGVLLTGMGRDGADGLLEIANAGGTTIVQDEATCIVFGMPQRAIELHAVQYVLPLEQIATKLRQFCPVPNKS